MTFQYSNPTGIQLSEEQVRLLAELDNIQSPLQGIKNFKDFHSSDNVEVVIVDSGYILKYLEDCRSSLNELFRSYRRQEDLNDRDKKLTYCLKHTLDNIFTLTLRAKQGELLGLYSNKVRWLDTERKPVIYFIADSIENYSETNGIDSRLVFGFVYAHEMMHAYYDSLNYRGYPPFNTLEESFAECGMLYYLSNINNTELLSGLYDAAKNDVISKQVEWLSYYGFGLDLFQHSLKEDKLQQHIERYREISNWINEAPWSDEYRRYIDMVYKLYPANDDTAQLSLECYKVVKDILYKDWSQPNVIVKEVGVKSLPVCSDSSDMWALHVNFKPQIELFPIFSSGKMADVTAKILLVLKQFYVESYFRVRKAGVLIEGIPIDCVDFDNGSTVIKNLFPVVEQVDFALRRRLDFIKEKLNCGVACYPNNVEDEKTEYGKILQLLVEMFPSNFSLIKEYGRFTLWGDLEAKELFAQIIGEFTISH